MKTLLTTAMALGVVVTLSANDVQAACATCGAAPYAYAPAYNYGYAPGYFYGGYYNRYYNPYTLESPVTSFFRGVFGN
jgi:hypothetical protein